MKSLRLFTLATATAATLALNAAIPDGATHIFEFNGSTDDTGSAQTFVWDGGNTSISYAEDNAAIAFGSDANSTPYGHGLSWPSSGTDQAWTIICRAKLPSGVKNSGCTWPVMWAIGCNANTTGSGDTSLNESYVFALCGNADGTGFSLRNGWGYPKDELLTATLSDGASAYHTFVVRITSSSGKDMTSKECAFELFVDGVSCGSVAKWFNPKQGCLRIGEYYKNAWYFSDGSGALDDLRTYSRALSYSEILEYTAAFETSGAAIECGGATGNDVTLSDTPDSVTSITKTGENTLSLVGNGVYGGAITVSAGTLKTGDYTTMDKIYSDYDAGKSTITYKDESAGTISSIASVAGTASSAFSFENNGATITADYFNGRQGILVAESTAGYVNYSDASKVTFIVARDLKDEDWTRLVYSGNAVWQTLINYESNASVWSRKIDGAAADPSTMRVNGTSEATNTGVEFLMAVTNVIHSSGWTYFFKDNSFVMGEVVGFSEYLDFSQVQYVEGLLMRKWGIEGTAANPFTTEAEIAVANGATLDIGYSVPSVKSLTLGKTAVVAVSGIVTKGTILATASESITAPGTQPLVINGEVSETLYPRAVKNTDGTWSLVAGGKRCGLMIVIM